MDKSAQIRALLRESPDLTPKEIQTRLAEDGVEVSRNLCKVVRHRELSGKRPKRDSSDRLRFDESRFGLAGVVRLSNEDLQIWNCLEKYAATLDDPASVLHRYQDWRFEGLEEVRTWIGRVTTRSARARRKAILQQFIEELRGSYPPPHASSAFNSGDQVRTELPPDTPSPPKSLFQGGKAAWWQDKAWVRQITTKAEIEIRHKGKVFSERSHRLLPLFQDQELVEHLLTSGPWHRHLLLTALTNSYSVVSIVDDLLEMAWSSPKPTNLVKALKELHAFDPKRGSLLDWKNRSETSALLFLLGLWICERIKVSRPDESGESQILIGTMNP